MSTIEERRTTFRTMHDAGFFVLPNAWDRGSATRLAKAGFTAIGTSSAAAAWSAGLDDGELGVEEVLRGLSDVVTATDVPVNADFEDGFADTPEGVAANIARAVETGIAGVSIEDWSGERLYDVEEAVQRISAARVAIDASAPSVMLIGRSEFFRKPDLPVADWISRAVAYAEAGADCLFVPFLNDHGAVRELISAVKPKPVSVLVGSFDEIPTFASIGVRRCSVGGALAAAAWRAFDASVVALKASTPE